jgi:hypothetical protein
MPVFDGKIKTYSKHLAMMKKMSAKASLDRCMSGRDGLLIEVNK